MQTLSTFLIVISAHRVGSQQSPPRAYLGIGKIAAALQGQAPRSSLAPISNAVAALARLLSFVFLPLIVHVLLELNGVTDSDPRISKFAKLRFQRSVFCSLRMPFACFGLIPCPFELAHWLPPFHGAISPEKCCTRSKVPHEAANNSAQHQEVRRSVSLLFAGVTIQVRVPQNRRGSHTGCGS
jgi:hypothetical protein